MAARSPSRENVYFYQLTTALSYAFTEWLLIFLLLIDAFCLCIVSKMFRSSKLQIPCLLCSRFGFLFGNEKIEFYKDLICDVHKLEVSSFIFCQVHKKLADPGGMCDSCLISFAKKKSSLEMCRFLLCKLRNDDHILPKTPDEMIEVPLLEENNEACSPNNQHCSCCSRLCRVKPFKEKSIFKELSFLDIELPGARRYCGAQLLGRLSEAREIPSTQLANYCSGKCSFDHLSQFEYRTLKFTSESDSEIPLSGDDDENHDGSIKHRQTEDVNEEVASSKCLSVVSDIIALEKSIHPHPLLSDGSSLISRSQPHEDDSCNKSIVESINVLGHGLEEIDWHNIVVKSNPTAVAQITQILVPSKISKIEDFTEADVSRTCSTSNVEVTNSLTITDINPKSGKVKSAHEDNVSSEPKGAPGIRCIESSWTDFELRPGKEDESRLSDTFSCNNLDAKSAFSESADRNLLSEIEGEGSADFSKQTTEMEHAFLSKLYKELEEERNASAIAANQAMAMINKLQEEKAAMQLEGMQFLRMMEEQTKYEQETHQNLNDQLAEKEKEIKDLKSELENYKKLCWGAELNGNIGQPWYDSDESEYSTTSTPHALKPRRMEKRRPTSITSQDFPWASSGSIKESLLDIEDERDYISQCLKRLETNVRLVSNADAIVNDEEDDDFNDETSVNDSKRVNCQENSGHSLCSFSTLEENCSSPASNSASSTRELDSDINNKHRKMCKRNDVMAGDEVEHLHARLEALENDRDFLECTINSLRIGKDGLRFVQEIATHLRELRKIGFPSSCR